MVPEPASSFDNRAIRIEWDCRLLVAQDLDFFQVIRTLATRVELYFRDACPSAVAASQHLVCEHDSDGHVFSERPVWDIKFGDATVQPHDVGDRRVCCQNEQPTAAVNGDAFDLLKVPVTSTFAGPVRIDPI